jgi:heme oxygenase
MTVTVQSNAHGLAAALRERTQAVHNETESTPFILALMDGQLPIEGYTALVAQNYAIYQALEHAADLWRDDAVAGPFVLEELVRVPHLEHDLAALLGPDWRSLADAARTPATQRYVEHITSVCTDWPAGFIAHHYVRYLGDLSGGQIIRQRIARIYGEVGQSASTFYHFDRIEKIKLFRDAYRELLDQAPLGVTQQRRVVAEAVRAFAFNRDIFIDLGEQFATTN